MKIKYEHHNFTDNTLAIIDNANAIITNYQAQGYKLTLRQLYYQFVARTLIPNNERSYKNLGTVISKARRAGMIDWESIEDRTRFLRGLTTYDSPQDAIAALAKKYHRRLWSDQPCCVEVWIEKDALVGVIEKICNDLAVDYFACRGYVSDSEMWGAAMRLGHMAYHKKKTCVVLHLGDHDPSGIDMTRDIQDRLDMFCGQHMIEVKRIAMTMDQIREQNPPPNPAKMSDSRYLSYIDKYGDKSWELDALEPGYIHDLIKQHVGQLRDNIIWDRDVNQERSERWSLLSVADNWDDIASKY